LNTSKPLKHSKRKMRHGLKLRDWKEKIYFKNLFTFLGFYYIIVYKYKIIKLSKGGD
jgi:hypothetical protein